MTYPSGGAGWIVRLDDIDDSFYFLLYDRKKKKGYWLYYSSANGYAAPSSLYFRKYYIGKFSLPADNDGRILVIVSDILLSFPVW